MMHAHSSGDGTFIQVRTNCFLFPICVWHSEVEGGIGSRADEAGPFLPASAAAGTLIPIPMCCRPFLPLYEVHCTDFASVASSLGDYAEVLIHTGLLELWVLKHSLRSACHTQPQHVLASCVELPLNTICDLLGLSTTSPGHAEQFEGNM